MKLHTDTLPYWIDSAKLPSFPKLERDETVDVVVVGGGITGLTAAYLLTLEGRRVALLEREALAEIDTGHTTAHLTMVTDLRMTKLVKSFGRDHAQAVWDAGLAAIAKIHSIVDDLNIDCDFAWVPGYLHAPIGQPAGNSAASFKEDASLASELGFDARFVDEVPFVGGPGVRFSDQARFHPRKYLAGLAQAIVDRGGMIFEHSRRRHVQQRSALDHVERPHAHVQGDRARDAQSAGRQRRRWSAPRCSRRSSRSTPATSSAAACKKGLIPDALFWDNADPYHYLRLERHARPRRRHLRRRGPQDRPGRRTPAAASIASSARCCR